MIESTIGGVTYIADYVSDKKQKAALAKMSPSQREMALNLCAALNRNVTAQEVFDEMGRRQGQQCGPEFSWHHVTQEFKTKFTSAYANKPRRQSAEDFAREFVDQWPIGTGAKRVLPEWRGILAQPPYTKNGLWPSDFTAAPGSHHKANARF
jgi:hypothetical protein